MPEEHWMVGWKTEQITTMCSEHLCSSPHISISPILVTGGFYFPGLVVGWGHVTSSGPRAMSRDPMHHVQATAFNSLRENFQNFLAFSHEHGRLR